MPIADISGLWLLDKPQGITSRTLGDKVAQKLHIHDFGHTGTLDPQASGLLILVSGRARKIQNFFTTLEKCYQAALMLGSFSETDDMEGPIVPCLGRTPPAAETVRNVVGSFQGQQVQTPPVYSAIKINGRRAYKLARQGEKVELTPRVVHIYQIEIMEYAYPLLRITVRCSAGTYIRSLARDIGSKLGTGGYLQALRRISIGSFRLEHAVTLDTITESARISLEKALADYPQTAITAEEWEKIRHGQKIYAPNFPQCSQSTFVRFQDTIVVWAEREGDWLCPKKLLAEPVAQE